MHTPIGVKTYAKRDQKSGGSVAKTGFAHISNGYKHIYIAI